MAERDAGAKAYGEHIRNVAQGIERPEFDSDAHSEARRQERQRWWEEDEARRQHELFESLREGRE